MKYYELQPEENTFSNIVVDLTHRCNMKCNNCYIPNRTIPDLDKHLLYAWLRKLPSKVYIRLIGAEPTMRSDLPEIIKIIKNMGHRPSLVTNGLKLHNIKYVKKLKQFGLRLILLSLNGADNDDIYQILDDGMWAKKKVRALVNVITERIPFNTGTIIAKNINENTMVSMVNLVENIALDNNINFDNDIPYKKITPVLRMKSIGKIGRYMEDSSLTTDELLSVLEKSKLNINFNDIHKVSAGVVKAGNYENKHLSSYFVPVITKAGKIYIRLIDWSIDEDGVVDAGNDFRGRLTQNWTIAPFFEHVKRNEGGY